MADLAEVVDPVEIADAKLLEWRAAKNEALDSLRAYDLKSLEEEHAWGAFRAACMIASPAGDCKHKVCHA